MLEPAGATWFPSSSYSEGGAVHLIAPCSAINDLRDRQEHRAAPALTPCGHLLDTSALGASAPPPVLAGDFVFVALERPRFCGSMAQRLSGVVSMECL